MTPTRRCMPTSAASCEKCEERMRSFTKLRRVWSVLCHALLLAGTGLTALSAVSCRTQRVPQLTLREWWLRCDTLMAVRTEYETVETVAQAVTGDTVSLTIPMAVMESLPEGAAFTRKEGRTRLSLKRQGNAVVAEAEADSIGRETRHYERKARDSLQRGTSAATAATVIKEKSPNGTWAIWVLAGMAGAIGAIIVMKRLFK